MNNFRYSFPYHLGEMKQKFPFPLIKSTLFRRREKERTKGVDVSLLSLKCFQPFKLHFIPIQISIRAISKAKLLLLIGLLSLLASSSTLAKKAPKKPLILQMEVSHPRNTDQISLIFKGNKVQLVTNTSSYQKGRVRLGVFHHPLNGKLTALRNSIEQYRQRLQKKPPKKASMSPMPLFFILTSRKSGMDTPTLKLLKGFFIKCGRLHGVVLPVPSTQKNKMPLCVLYKQTKLNLKRKQKVKRKKEPCFQRKT